MKKILILLLLLFGIGLASPTVLALNSVSADDYDSAVTVSDENSQTSNIQMTSANNFTITNEDGTTSEVYVDEQKNIYINGVLEVTAEEYNNMVQFEQVIEDPLPTTRAAATWHYLDTLNYNIDFQNRTKDIMLTVIGAAIPFMSPAIGVGTILDSLFSQSAPGMYVTVRRYYRTGNQYYKYCYSFYSDAARKHRVAYREEIKKMW